MKKLKDSPFGNAYGSLSLYIDEEKVEYYLKMEDCFGPDVFGPLAIEQVFAFYILCEAKESNYK